jgi:hypothetical protein
MHLNYGVHIFGSLLWTLIPELGGSKVDPYCLGFKNR